MDHILREHHLIFDVFLARMAPVFAILKTSETSRKLITHLSSLHSVDGVLIITVNWEDIDSLAPELVKLPDFNEAYKQWNKSRGYPNKDTESDLDKSHDEDESEHETEEEDEEDPGPEEYVDTVLSLDPVFKALEKMSPSCADLHTNMVVVLLVGCGSIFCISLS